MANIPQLSLKKVDYNPLVFTPTTAELQTPDLSIAERSLALREARHEKAINQKTEIDKVLAGIETSLHNDDKKWFSDYKRNIEKNIKNEIDAGNFGSAYRMTTMYAGDITKDSAIQGRIQANAEYQTEVNKQKDRVSKGEISQDTFDYWASKNPYTYHDVTDEAGNVISGSGWKANTLPYNDISWAKVAATSYQMYRPDTIYGQGSKGGMTEDNMGHTESSWAHSLEQVTPENLEKTMNLILDSEPGWRESAKQDYDVTVWKYYQEKEKINSIENPEEKQRAEDELNIRFGSIINNGQVITPSEYYRNMILGYSEAGSYKKEITASGSDNTYHGSRNNTTASGFQQGQGYGPGANRFDRSPGADVVVPQSSTPANQATQYGTDAVSYID